jgi:hypothetical protein
MARALRSPLLHFLVLGAALVAFRARFEASDGERPSIVIAARERARLREAWTEVHGTPPAGAVEERLVRDAIDEEVLYREALARGFDRRDEAVRERLVRLGGFVGEETAADRAALEHEARRLGLAHTDLVVRRQLVEMMRLASGRVGPEDLPSEADLQAYLAQQAGEFAQPARARLTHIFLSAATRGAALPADAAALLAALRASGTPPDQAVRGGDVFIRGADFDAPPAELERVFGAGFAAAVDAAVPGGWIGPVRSAYGLHLVWVHAREPARTPALAAVRGRVLHRWLRERSAARAREALAAMRARYAVVTADVASRGR